MNEDDSLEQLEERLETLPTKLEGLYAHTLMKINSVDLEGAALLLKFALLEGSDTPLDFTLANYPQLDHDLGSWPEIPSNNVISRCQPTRRRIVTFLHRTVADVLYEPEHSHRHAPTSYHQSSSSRNGTHGFHVLQPTCYRSCR